MQKRVLEENDATDKLVRLNQILEIIPVSRATWWNGVRCGKYPPAIKLGPKLTCWRLSEIMRLAEKGTGEGRYKSFDRPQAD